MRSLDLWTLQNRQRRPFRQPTWRSVSIFG